MKEEDFIPELYEIGEEFGLKGNYLDIFVTFFKERFQDTCSHMEEEGAKEYAREWASRFMSLKPESHMDYQSKRVYENVVTRLPTPFLRG